MQLFEIISIISNIFHLQISNQLLSIYLNMFLELLLRP